ncbi:MULTISPECIES: peptidase U32 family protein [Pelosinus]|uniref:Peptidase U32 n=1 Tax=Pelosinus fermentans B4 TaxID=1149862 RepID=I8RJN0_9FIRM|nr:MULTISPECIES: U32 family peptidase [Pelosinus]EIW18420.1 peptidase U32 [Pelosinus fermentans B4]EIW24433.1 peptidase U32 [Pelosinus fermentans A11]OAM94508.1 peptidase U32 [Pelosinus fermentans DSM 17108]SDR10913.1 putative protease [Pelosinus fermentans]
MKKPELLAPAGNLEKLKMALLYGADAVFMAGKSFGLRAFSDNFTEDELKKGVEFAHSLQKKAYVTVNIFPHNEDLPALPDYIRYLSDCHVDAVIVADLGVYRMIRKVAPNLPIHISTQANNTNWSSVLFWQELGVHRVVLARELSLADITVIRDKVTIELEAFIHGAMCISYSGRCLMSNYFTDRDANRGQCAQPCRWKFNLVEEKRPGEYYPVMEDERGTYIFNSKDLCLLPHIPELIDSGLDSFKVEGRMKSVHYAATVIKVYREAIDAYVKDPEHYSVKAEWLEELQKISHRAYTSGFYFNKATQEDQIYGTSSYEQTFDFIGLVKSYDPATKMATIEQRNNLKVGQEIEIMQPGKPNFNQVITEMFDIEDKSISTAPHPQQLFKMRMCQEVVEYAMLRREVQKNA